MVRPVPPTARRAGRRAASRAGSPSTGRGQRAAERWRAPTCAMVGSPAPTGAARRTAPRCAPGGSGPGLVQAGSDAGWAKFPGRVPRVAMRRRLAVRVVPRSRAPARVATRRSLAGAMAATPRRRRAETTELPGGLAPESRATAGRRPATTRRSGSGARPGSSAEAAPRATWRATRGRRALHRGWGWFARPRSGCARRGAALDCWRCSAATPASRGRARGSSTTSARRWVVGRRRAEGARRGDREPRAGRASRPDSGAARSTSEGSSRAGSVRAASARASSRPAGSVRAASARASSGPAGSVRAASARASSGPADSTWVGSIRAGSFDASSRAVGSRSAGSRAVGSRSAGSTPAGPISGPAPTRAFRPWAWPGRGRRRRG
jgi:hypothetical protein